MSRGCGVSTGKSYRLPAGWEDSVRDWVMWLRASGVSDRTIHTRRGHVRVVARLTQLRHPREVVTGQLVALYAEQGWGLEHRRGMRTSLNQFYIYCIKNGVCQENPAEGLPHIPESKGSPRPAPEWLWAELLESAGARELLMVRLAGEVGLRRAEIAQVQRDDVIWDGSGWALIVHGKGGKQRVVPINDRLAQQLQQRPDWIPVGVPFTYIFPSLDRWGNVVAPFVSPDRVGRLISDLMPVGWSGHKLRHRYATRGYAGTRNLRAVQEALGHASVATTQRYTATAAVELRAVSDAVAG